MLSQKATDSYLASLNPQTQMCPLPIKRSTTSQNQLEPCFFRQSSAPRPTRPGPRAEGGPAGRVDPATTWAAGPWARSPHAAGLCAALAIRPQK